MTLAKCHTGEYCIEIGIGTAGYGFRPNHTHKPSAVFGNPKHGPACFVGFNHRDRFFIRLHITQFNRCTRQPFALINYVHRKVTRLAKCVWVSFRDNLQRQTNRTRGSRIGTAFPFADPNKCFCPAAVYFPSVAAGSFSAGTMFEGRGQSFDLSVIGKSISREIGDGVISFHRNDVKPFRGKNRREVGIASGLTKHWAQIDFAIRSVRLHHQHTVPVDFPAVPVIAMSDLNCEGDGLPGDPRFFGPRMVRSLGEVAQAAGAAIDPLLVDRQVVGVAPLQIAGPAHVSFLDNRRYANELAASAAGVVICRPELAGRAPSGCVVLAAAEPYLAWARVAALFHPLPPGAPGIHPTAVVDPTATVDASAEIGPYVVIGAEAEVGPRCRLAAFVAVGGGVRIGADCRIGTHVSLSHALIGARVVLYPGVKIGQDGFGFATGPAGHVSVPQLGRVVVEDDVEIGANTTVDRGSLHDTVIGAGSRLDNLVQVGHNVRLGRCCVIVGQAGISGSTVLEDFVVLAGQSGIAGHLKVGRGARIGARSGVMNDMPAGAEWVGAPAVPVREFFRQFATLKRLAARKTETKTE